MQSLDTARIVQAASLAPFDGWLLSDIIRVSPEDLCRQYPEQGFASYDIQPDEAAPGYLGGKLEVYPLGANAADLAPPWKELVAEIRSAEYDDAIASFTRQRLAIATKRIRLVRYRVGSYIATHFDNQPNKILTQIFYFNRLWESQWGGSLELLLGYPAADQKIFSILPVISNSVILQSTERAYHRVSRVCSAEAPPRNTMLIEWFCEKS